MTRLCASFEKRYPRGAVIRADYEQQADGFSVTALFGPSGCGKTTILRCLAGLERPETGTIRFQDETWFDASKKIFCTPQQRDIGYLFQEYALFPHLTVEKNIGYGLRDVSSTERRRRVAEMLDLFELNGLAHRYPSQVSGGQQQRAALARVMARRPRLLLLDEPLSALDASLREEIRRELRLRLSEFDIPVVLVTHDRTEAIALADEVVIIEDGVVLQQGPVLEVFNRPATLSAARIVGVETVERVRILRAGEGWAEVAIGDIVLTTGCAAHLNGEGYACVRAEEVTLHRGQTSAPAMVNQLEARVTAVIPEGPLVRVSIDCGFRLTSLLTRPVFEEMGLRVGESVYAVLKPPAIHLAPPRPNGKDAAI